MPTDAPPLPPPRDRRLRQQIERAARIQRSLLPDVSLPIGEFRLAGLYCPCESLGGDFYDLYRRAECAVLLVADAMGHGLDAALITMLVKAAFQESAAAAGSPGEILSQMDARLHRTMPDDTFVAAAVTSLGCGGPVVRFANAGLPYPLVLRASTHEVEPVRLGGLPLGLVDHRGDEPYETRDLQLAHGDLLLIASDGIGSVEGAGGQCFEDGRLRDTLEHLAGRDGRSVIDSLMADAVDFGRGQPLPDDINLVAVSRDGCGAMREANRRSRDLTPEGRRGGSQRAT